MDDLQLEAVSETLFLPLYALALESWAPGIRLLDEWSYFDEAEPKLRRLRPFAWFNFVRRAQWTVHYRLGAAGRTAPDGP
ncbi:MAG: hypothetical protein V3S29_05410 [bacterium]